MPVNVLHLHIALNTSCGITRQLSSIAQWRSENISQYIAAPGGDAFERMKSRFGNIIKIKRISLFPQFISDLLVIYQLIRIKRISIVHTHHRYYALIVHCLSFFLSFRHVITVHSIVKGKRFFSYKADRIIAVSDSVKSHLLRYFHIKPEKIQLLYNCIDPGSYIPSFEVKNESFQPVIGYIGRFDWEKGTDILLSIYEKSLLNFSEVRLLLAGSGALEKMVEEFAEKYPDRVVLKKNVENISLLYEEIDIVVLPSRIDPFPFVMLESGFFKKAFIGFAVDGISEFISDGMDGILVPPDKYELLTERIKYLLINPGKRLELAENLNKKVTSSYMIDGYRKELFQLYGNLQKEPKLKF
ncbi:MAG: D-inositol-3-phosphate glycosyltransferase [Ignavibacteriaceae bacterium]|nr:D-inositol-3-phosphate glycosyltransferase [Ignavibacteriaceae bacterium]